MKVIYDEEIKIVDYKCFDKEGAGFEKILPINIIIGKNNSGKSSLLEGIKVLTDDGPEKLENTNNRTRSEVRSFHRVTKDDVDKYHKTFQVNKTSINKEAYIYFSNMLDKLIYFFYKKSGNQLTFDYSNLSNSLYNVVTNYVKKFASPFQKKIFYHIAAERNITPEKKEQGIVHFPNGEKVTNFIQQIINVDRYDRNLIEVDLLDKLNLILNPDIKFKRILVQENEKKQEWEIYFEDCNNLIIPLSKMGSGVKTVLHVLVGLIVQPKISNKSEASFVFAFEELENNLHPALQRRLYSYIKEYSEKHDCIFFITTHSNIVIDAFGTYENSQIIHVLNDGEKTITRTLLSSEETKSLLDDLGAKASDILQSNCVIWVEGPSDRNYLNKWLSLFAPQLIEGLHYSIMFYGGSTLANISFDNDEYFGDLVPLIKMNQNAYVIMDRDGESSRAKLVSRKKRIIEELGKEYCWVTKGREIENYLNKEVMTRWLEDYYKNKYAINYQYDENLHIDQTIHKSVDKAKTITYSGNKTAFSAKICKFIDENSLECLDLKIKLNELVAHIVRWNFIDIKKAK